MTVRDSAVAVGRVFQLALVRWASWKTRPHSRMAASCLRPRHRITISAVDSFLGECGGARDKRIVRTAKNGGVGFGGLGAKSRGTYAETDAVNAQPAAFQQRG